MYFNWKIGPLRAAWYSRDNWSAADLAYTTNPNGGDAKRTSVARLSFKSEHLIELLGRDNHEDVVICPDTGKPVYGRIVRMGKGVFVIPAYKVLAKQQLIKRNNEPVEVGSREMDEQLVREAAQAEQQQDNDMGFDDAHGKETVVF